MATTVDTLFNHVQQFFTNNNKWSSSIQTANKVSFNSKYSPYDEYVIENPSTNEITVSIPLNEVAYKKSFSLRKDNINSIVDYVKMHLEYYENKYKY